MLITHTLPRGVLIKQRARADMGCRPEYNAVLLIKRIPGFHLRDRGEA